MNLPTRLDSSSTVVVDSRRRIVGVGDSPTSSRVRCYEFCLSRPSPCPSCPISRRDFRRGQEAQAHFEHLGPGALDLVVVAPVPRRTGRPVFSCTRTRMPTATTQVIEAMENSQMLANEDIANKVQAILLSVESIREQPSLEPRSRTALRRIQDSCWAIARRLDGPLP